jgi:hypothetical protein
MKKYILTVIVLMMGLAVQAQSFRVNSKGSSPNISDFVTAVLLRDGDEFIRGTQENWTRRQQGKPLEDGASFTVDAKNGFARFDKRYSSNTYSYVEICYWNCSDKKRKIIAVNSGCIEQGRHVNSEFTTLKFYVYNNQSKTMEWLSRQDIGAAINVSSVVSYVLPQAGKDIMATIHSERGEMQILMKWDGMQFHQEQVGRPAGNVQVSNLPTPKREVSAPLDGSFGETIQYKDDTYIRVYNAEQFLNALGSNRNILVAKNTQINLTPILDDESRFRTRYKMWMPDASNGINDGRETIVSEEVFDGRQLTLVNINQLTIEGEQNSRIVVEPRYAFCLNFVDCKHCTVRNLTIGHTEGGYCEGGVIGIKRGWRNMVSDCDLYGCGTYGLDIDGTNSFSLYSTNIHDCTYGIMQLRNSEAVQCTHCDFFNNREFALIESSGCVGTVFEDCRFFANWGDAALFSFDREFTLMGCAVYHPTENLGTMNLCEQPGAENMFSENPLDTNIKGREIGPDSPSVNARGE